jgi:hypothetical protein
MAGSPFKVAANSREAVWFARAAPIALDAGARARMLAGMDNADRDQPPPKPTRRPERLAREAAALRANLLKRKDQSRQRAASRADAPPPPTKPDDR